jgi:Trp operon repressor
MRQQLLQKLLDKDMNRREFLAHLGAGILAVIGVSGLLKHIVNYSSAPQRESGYGSHAYGGKERSNGA